MFVYFIAVVVSTIFELMAATAPDLYQSFEILDGLIALILLLAFVGMLVAYVVWIFKIHVDLNKLFPDYPITPKRSMALTLIPLYNLWGIWKIANTIHRRFTDLKVNMLWFGMDLKFMYIFLLVLGRIDRIMLKESMKPSYQEWTKRAGLRSRLAGPLYPFSVPFCGTAS